MKDIDNIKGAIKAHKNVPPDWYYNSIRKNILQKYWHQKRFEEVGKLIVPVKGEVLDIGSADGVFSKHILIKTGAKKIAGIDILKSSVDWANKHWKKEGKMQFRMGDAHKLKFPSSSFAAVFALEVLEHVRDPKKVLREVKRVLKKGGYAIFLVPSDSLLFRFIWFFWTKLRGKIWKDAHIQSYKNNYLIKIVKNIGFKVEKNNKFILDMLQVVRVRKS